MLVYSYGKTVNKDLKHFWWIAQQVAHALIFSGLGYIVTETTGVKFRGLWIILSILLYMVHYLLLVIIAAFIFYQTYHVKSLIVQIRNAKKNSLIDDTNNSSNGSNTGSREKLAKNVEQNLKENDHPQKEGKQGKEGNGGNQTGTTTPAQRLVSCHLQVNKLLMQT